MTDSTSTQKKIIGLGFTCLDIILFKNKVHYMNGGSCCNVISALTYLGWKGTLVLPSYTDSLGEEVYRNLQAIKVNLIKTKSKTNTPRIIEELSHDKGFPTHRFFLRCPNCGRQLPRFKPLPRTALNSIYDLNYDVLYTDRIYPGISQLNDIFIEQNKWTIYEPNSRRNLNYIIEKALEFSIIKFSKEKVPSSFAEEIRKRAFDNNPMLIIQTLGSDGLIYSYRESKGMSDWYRLKAHPVSSLVDMSGAGDWLTAGILCMLIKYYPIRPDVLTHSIIETALEYGQSLAAASCSYLGGQGLLYSRNEFNTQIEQKAVLVNAEEGYSCSTCFL